MKKGGSHSYRPFGKCRRVIACDKRKAFAQGSEATKQSISPHKERMDCFAALAMTASPALSGL
jgi:hypothetical protein